MRSGPVIPTIDIAALGSSDIADRRVVAQAIGAACEDTGFFTVINHGVHASTVGDAFREARRAFGRPMAEKLMHRLDDRHPNQGYDPIGGQTLDPSAEPDLKESWSFSSEDYPGAGHPMQGANRWPPLEGFKTPIQRYHTAVMGLAEQLLRAMALSLDLDESAFAEYHRDPICTLRLLHYPARADDATELSFGAGTHTDWGALTLLAQDDAGSLEVLDRSGRWIDVPPVDGAFVVNVGDLLALWTNDRYTSTPHRVRGAVGQDRYSIACFFDLDPEKQIETLPTCVTADRPARYAPTTPGEHLTAKYRASMSVGSAA